MNKEEARKEVEFYKTLASNHEALVKGCNEKILELEALINKPDRWQDSLVQPDKEGYSYLISSEYEGLVVGWSAESNRRPEHAFKTKVQAELIKEKVLLMQEMHSFAHVRNEGWIADWEEDWQAKYGIVLSDNKAYADYSCRINQFVFGVTVKSREIAQEMLKEFGGRIEEVYSKIY